MKSIYHSPSPECDMRGGPVFVRRVAASNDRTSKSTALTEQLASRVRATCGHHFESLPRSCGTCELLTHTAEAAPSTPSAFDASSGANPTYRQTRLSANVGDILGFSP